MPVTRPGITLLDAALSQEHNVDNVDLVKQLIEEANHRRSVGSTAANADSSRSHSIMQFALKRFIAGGAASRLVSVAQAAGSSRRHCDAEAAYCPLEQECTLQSLSSMCCGHTVQLPTQLHVNQTNRKQSAEQPGAAMTAHPPSLACPSHAPRSARSVSSTWLAVSVAPTRLTTTARPGWRAQRSTRACWRSRSASGRWTTTRATCRSAAASSRRCCATALWGRRPAR